VTIRPASNIRYKKTSITADLDQLLKQSQERKGMIKKLVEKATKLEKQIADTKDRQIESDQRNKSRKW
jgi:hypothetical protein